MVTGSHHRHAHRDPVTGIRTAVCRCTGSSPQGSRSSRGQPAMSRLSCTHAATKAWAGCLCKSWLWQGRKEKGQAGTLVAGVCKLSIYEAKNGQLCRASMVAVLATGFFSSESFWGPLRSRSLGTVVIPTVWLIPIAPVLLPCSWPSRYSQFCQSLDGVKPKQGPSCCAPNG